MFQGTTGSKITLKPKTTYGPRTTYGPKTTEAVDLGPTKGNFNTWIPYIVVIAGSLLFVFIGLCLFCKCFRAYWCSVFFCCCYDCCCAEKSTENAQSYDNQNVVMESPSRSISSESNSGGNAQSRLPLPPPLPPLPTPSSHPRHLHHGGPKKHHLVNTARTQKYIGNLLASGRRPPAPMSTSPSPAVAPPAAKQVARTVKIIGNILTHDNNKRRRR